MNVRLPSFVLAVLLAALPPAQAEHEPAVPTLFVEEFVQIRPSPTFGDLASFATTLVQLRLGETRKVKVVRGLSAPTCRGGQGDLSYYTVRGTLDVQGEEVLLRYEFLRTDSCEPRQIFSRSAAFSESDALKTLNLVAEILASSLAEEDQTEKVVISLEPVSGSADKALRNDLGTYLALKLSSADFPRSFEIRGEGAEYGIETRLVSSGKRVEAHFEIKSAMGDRVGIAVTGDISQRLKFLEDASETLLRALDKLHVEQHSGIGSLSAVPVEELVRMARQLLCLELEAAVDCIPQLEAMTLLREALRRTPADPIPLELLGRAQLIAGAPASAAQLFERAWSVGGQKDLVSLLRAADSWYDAKDYGKAAKLYESLLERLGSEGETMSHREMRTRSLLQLGRARRLASGRVGALDVFATAAAEGNAEARRELLGLLRELDATELAQALPALAALTSSLGTDPLAQAKLRLAEMELERADTPGELEAVRGQLEAAVALEPSAAQLREELLAELGDLYRYMGDFRRAQDLYRRARQESQPGPKLLNNLGALSFDQGNLAEAETFFREALERSQDAAQPDPAQRAEALTHLGELYLLRGELKAAQVPFEEALAAYRNLYAPRHPEVANSVRNLGRVAFEEADYARAEDLFRQAWEIRKESLGEAHPDVAVSLGDLASVQLALGHLDQAVPRYEQALEILEAAFGPGHPQVARALRDLGHLRSRQGLYREAEALYRRSLEIWTHIFGDHYESARGLVDLGAVLTKAGRYGEARDVFFQASEVAGRSFGEKHELQASALGHLGEIESRLGNHSQAEALERQSIQMYEEIFGPDHLKIVQNVNVLGNILLSLGRYDEAEVCYQRALRIQASVLGPDSLGAASILNNLGNLHASQARWREAERAYRNALAIKERWLGPDHPETSSTLLNLGQLYQEFPGREQESKPFFDRALTIAQRSLGSSHPRVAVILHNLGLLALRSGNRPGAEELFLAALAIEEESFGPTSPDLAKTLRNLGSLYAGQGDAERAEAYLRRASGIYQAALGPDHPLVAHAQGELADLYAPRESQKAEELYKGAVSIVEKRKDVLSRVLIRRFLRNYALLLRSMDRNTEAAELEARVRSLEKEEVGRSREEALANTE